MSGCFRKVVGPFHTEASDLNTALYFKCCVLWKGSCMVVTMERITDIIHSAFLRTNARGKKVFSFNEMKYM